MAQNVFDYQTLFAQELPEARNIWGSRRGKYDFAIAYPDPASIPCRSWPRGPNRRC